MGFVPERWMPELKPDDWAAIIRDIGKHGITPYKLALMAGIDKKTMAHYAAGRLEPRHSVGEWLKMLRAELGEKIPS